MTKFWRVKREAQRLWQQLASIPAFFIEYFQQKKYDLNFNDLVEVFDGTDQATSQYAIVLSYQPKGLSRSSLFTCEHLKRNGYKVFLISNARLAPQDLSQLKSLTWKIMIRPNFGYDFGGYRDGIRWLKQKKILPSRLLLLNDSTWYPLYSEDHLLRRIHESSADCVGALQLDKIRQPGKVVFESYFYSFSGTFFVSEIFTAFWANYLLSNIKQRAISNGEKKFSKIMLNASTDYKGIFTSSEFLELLKKQDSNFLQKTLLYAAYVDDSYKTSGIDLLQRFDLTEDWHSAVVQHVAAVCRRRHFHASFCYATIRLLGVPFLKKSHLPLHIRMRQQYCKAVLNGDLPRPSSKSMLDEIQSHDSPSPSDACC